MKGQCQKIESLGDGSFKLSIYVPKELKREAVDLAYEEVTVTKSGDLPVISDQVQALISMRNTILIMAESLQELSAQIDKLTPRGSDNYRNQAKAEERNLSDAGETLKGESNE